MTASIIQPLAVTTSNLTATNLTESTSAWDAGTTYAAGDEVHVVADRLVYISAVDSNTGNVPSETLPSDADPVGKWIIKGAMNKWAAFDGYKANSATRAGSITYTIEPETMVTNVTFFKLFADSVTVTVTNGATVLEYTKALNNYSHVTNWFTFLFAPWEPDRKASFEIPYLGAGTVINIEITSSGTASVGQIVLGRQHFLGIAVTPVPINFNAYSVYNVDQFGNLAVTKRPIVSEYNFEVHVENLSLERTQQILKDAEGLPTAFFATSDDNMGLAVFGVLQKFDANVLHKDHWRVRAQMRELL